METTGKTVDEAKDAALDQLGVDESDAEFVIVSEPKAGLFGRVKGEARVRARVMPTSPRPKRGRSRRSDQRRSGSRTQSGSGGGRPRADGGDGSSVAVAERQARQQPPADSGGAPGAASPSGAKRRRRGSRGRGRGGSASANGAGASAAPGSAAQPPRQGSNSGGRQPRAAGEAKEETVGEVLSLTEQGETAREFIDGLVRELGLSASVSVKVLDEETAEVAVDGPELGILIGPGGATLAALQELARTVVQRRTGGHSDRILVDVAGYRAKRVEALQRFTRQIADDVLAAGGERALEPMSAADRKVVHDTVNEIDGVATRSEGEEPRRYIVISAGAGGDGG